MNRTMNPILRWAPWAALAALAVLFVAEQVRSFQEFDLASHADSLIFSALIGMLAVFLLGLAIAVVEEEARSGRMRARVRRLLYWTPRAALLLFAAMVSLFALDVFGEGYGFWETILALVMHLIPTFGLLIAAALAWRWPLIGAALMGVWAVWYLSAMGFRFDLTVYVGMVGIPILLGVLFLLNWRYREELANEP